MDKSLKLNLDILRPLIYVVTEEEDRLLKDIYDQTKENSELYIYRATAGIVSYADWNREDSPEKEEVIDTKSMPVHVALTEIQKRQSTEKRLIFVLLDPDHLFQENSPANCQSVRKLKDIVLNIYHDYVHLKSIIVVSSALCIPSKLKRYSEVIFYDLPDNEDIEEKVKYLLNEYNTILGENNKISVDLDESLKMCLKGLTLFEIEQIVMTSLKKHKKLINDEVNTYKKTILKKTDLLDLMSTEVTFDQIGGLNKAKHWIEKRQDVWCDEAIRLKIPTTKGIIVIGTTGCGKSLLGKAIGNQWNLPCISFSPSKIFSSQVGSSETRMMNALKILESVAPCITGDSRITLGSGQVASIEELYENKYRDTVASFDDDFEIVNSKVKLITKKETNDLYNLRTSVGNIKATGDHKFPVLESNGELHWKELKCLKTDDAIVCPRKLTFDQSIKFYDYLSDDTRIYSKKIVQEFSEKSKLPLSHLKKRQFVYKKEIEKHKLDFNIDYVDKYTEGKGGFQDSFFSKLPDTMTEDFFYAMGLLWSDGNLGDRSYWLYDDKNIKTKRKNALGFVNTCKELHFFLIDYFKKDFGLKLRCYSKHDGNEKHKVGFVTMGIPTSLSNLIRRVQYQLLKFEEKFIWAWLSGVIDGDGCIMKGKVNFTAIKHKNNEYIRDALLRVGIATSTYQDDFKSHKVNLTSNALILASKYLKLRHPKKILGMKNLRFDGTKSRFDTIDVKEKIVQLLLEKEIIICDTKFSPTFDKRTKFFLKKSLKKKDKTLLHSYACYPRSMSTERTKEVFESLNESQQWFFKEHFFFSKVEQISKIHGKHNVYDLCLDKNHNFIANRMFTHNCVVMIDEIEKQFAGSQSSTFSDAGTTARVIGTFLTWYQDCTAPIFIVATCNSIQYLPPELISRFDDKFFVPLPSNNDRAIIYDIHIRKTGRDPNKLGINVQELASKSPYFSGREIEQVVKAGLIEMWYERRTSKTEIELTQDHLLKVLSSKIPMQKTMQEELDYLVQWVGWDEEKKEGIRANYASEREDDIDMLFTEILSKPSVLDKNKKK